MPYEAWRAIAERFGRRYGVEVFVGGDRCTSTATTITLPGDVPEKMQDAVHAMFLREKERIIQEDHKFNSAQNDEALKHALLVVQDIHNDQLVLEADPGAVGLFGKMQDYLDTKMPVEAQRKHLKWRQKCVLELYNRAWARVDRSLADGRHLTDDRQVKHFFKRNKREIRLMLTELQDLRPDRDAQVRWAKWLVDQLFDQLIEETLEDLAKKLGIPVPAGGFGGAAGLNQATQSGSINDPNTPLGQMAQAMGQAAAVMLAVQDAIAEAIEKMGGLVPKQMRTQQFECLSPGDLKQKVPEATTIQQLKEFLTDKLEEKVPEDTGNINTQKLPQYWDENQDLFQQDTEKIQKRIRITMLLDASGSMVHTLECGNRRIDALIRAVGLVAQASMRIERDEGYEVGIEAWGFGSQDRLVKRIEERWDPGDFKRRLWKGGDGDTRPSKLIQQVAAVPTDIRTKDVVLVVTDGVFSDDGVEKMKEAAHSAGKSWLLIGLGEDIPDHAKSEFRFVAKSLDEIEYILVQTVKEAAR